MKCSSTRPSEDNPSDIEISIVTPLIILILFSRFSVKSGQILNEHALMAVSGFVMSNHWPKCDTVSKFEFGSVKLAAIDSFPLKKCKQRKSTNVDQN